MTIITIQTAYRAFLEDDLSMSTTVILPWTEQQLDITHHMLGMGPLLTEQDIAAAATKSQYVVDPFGRIEYMRKTRAMAVQSIFDGGARAVMQAINQHEGFQNLAEEVRKWAK